MNLLPKLLSTEPIASSPWLNFKSLTYDNGVNWSFIERSNHSIESADAVVIVPIDRARRKILIIEEFRYALNSTIIDLPAGLLDTGESVETAALRELKEETGYSGVISKVLKPSFSSAGLTNEKVAVVYVNVDSTSSNLQALDRNELISFKWLNFIEAMDLATNSDNISSRAQLIMINL